MDIQLFRVGRAYWLSSVEKARLIGLQYRTQFTVVTDRRMDKQTELAAMLRGSRPGLQSASLIMTSLMTS